MIRVLSLGAGVQSTTLLLMSLRGDLPKLDAAVFADTQWEPNAVYTHLEWLKGLCKNAGLPLYTGTAGILRKDAIDFRRMWKSADDGKKKRFASIPVFVRNDNGTQGRVKRQCTKEYKIEVVNKIIRREIMGLAPRQRAPKEPTIEHWFGITTDEAKRAVFPGRWEEVEIAKQGDFFGASAPVKEKRWRPTKWEIHTYPFMNVSLHSDRKCEQLAYLSHTMTRNDCKSWLEKN